jgi:hypothetical protein
MGIRTQVLGGRLAEDSVHKHPTAARITAAFYVQSAISFAVFLVVTILGIGYLHDSRWVNAFLAFGLLCAVSSSFTLAKCIHDR